MEHLYPENLEQLAPQLAHHFTVAGDNQRALQYLSLAGDAALNTYANQEAESRYRQALNLDSTPAERAALLYKLGQALYWQSRFQDAIKVWRDGIRLYRDLGDSDGVAQLYARSTRAVWDAGLAAIATIEPPFTAPLGLRGRGGSATTNVPPSLSSAVHVSPTARHR